MTANLAKDPTHSTRPELPALPAGCYWEVGCAALDSYFTIHVKERRDLTKPGRWPWSKPVEYTERVQLGRRMVTNASGFPVKDLTPGAIIYSAEALLAEFARPAPSADLLGVYPVPLNLGLTK